MAGIKIKDIKNALGDTSIIRAMPNLGIEFGASMTGWVAGSRVKRSQKKLAQKIFDLWGKQIELKNEDQIDKLTAISGSGPAYFFYLSEAIQKAAENMGFKSDEAQLLVQQTLIAASKSQINFKEARLSVTSKGGTTEAAINFLDKNRFSDVMIGAINQAYLRAHGLCKTPTS